MVDLHGGVRPETDLVVSRVLNASPKQIWTAWSSAHSIMQWWAPTPVVTSDCELDFRAGGILRTTMRLPDGKEIPTLGIFLEVVPHRLIVMTMESLRWPG